MPTQNTSATTASTSCVAVIEIDHADQDPSTFIDGINAPVAFVPAPDSPRGFQWYELHVPPGLHDREELVIRQCLAALHDARDAGRLQDLRIVIGSEYLALPVVDVPSTSFG